MCGNAIQLQEEKFFIVEVDSILFHPINSRMPVHLPPSPQSPSENGQLCCAPTRIYDVPDQSLLASPPQSNPSLLLMGICTRTIPLITFQRDGPLQAYDRPPNGHTVRRLFPCGLSTVFMELGHVTAPIIWFDFIVSCCHSLPP